MNSLLEELIEVLEDQSSLHRSLISVLLDEKAAIIGSKLIGLNKTNEEKKTLILKIEKLEDKRIVLLSALANARGDEGRGFTLEKVCKITDEHYSSRLNFLRNDLMLLLSKVKELNDDNKILLTSSIEFIRGSLAIFNKLMTLRSNTVYYPSGKIENRDHSGRVLSGEI